MQQRERGAQQAAPGGDGAVLTGEAAGILRLPNAHRKEVSVTDKGKLGGGMITGRSGAAERSARLTSGLSGLAERRPRRTQEDTGGHRRRRADVETWKRGRCPSDAGSPSPRGPSTFLQASDWTK